MHKYHKFEKNTWRWAIYFQLPTGQPGAPGEVFDKKITKLKNSIPHPATHKKRKMIPSSTTFDQTVFKQYSDECRARKHVCPHCLQVSSTVACRSTTTQRTAICPFSSPSGMHSTTSKRRREGSNAMGRHGSPAVWRVGIFSLPCWKEAIAEVKFEETRRSYGFLIF